MGQIVSQYTNCCDGRCQFPAPTAVTTAGTKRLLDIPSTNDYKKFEQARNSSDLSGLVKLLESSEPLPKAYRTASVHPWAKAPETVGTLVAAHLAVVISSSEDKEVIEKLVDLGIAEALTTFLKSDAPDRVHASAVSLVFLTEKSSFACSQLCDLDVHNHILAMVNTGVASVGGGVGLQLTLMSLLRNIARSRSEIIEPIAKNVSFLLTNILNGQLARRLTPQTNDYVLECLQIISDLVEASPDVMKPFFINERFKAMLQTTKTSSDPDIADETRRLLALF